MWVKVRGEEGSWEEKVGTLGLGLGGGWNDLGIGGVFGGWLIFQSVSKNTTQ